MGSLLPELLAPCALAGIACFLMCGMTIWLSQRYKIGMDCAFGVRRIHRYQTPRLGGGPIFLAFCLVDFCLPSHIDHSSTYALCVLTLPVLAVGLYEDLTGRAGVGLRLFVSLLAAAVAATSYGLVLRSVQINVLDMVLQANLFIAVLFTTVAMAGIPHAINIIDGCNGLAGWTSTAALSGIGLVAAANGDHELARISWIGAGVVLGFMAWNFPFGKLFLGDSGAYLLGLLIAELAVLLLVRNPRVSPWCPLLLVIYPVWETLFSIWRRARINVTQITSPDARHLHQLVYSFLLMQLIGLGRKRRKAVANSLVAVPFAAWSASCMLLAVRFWDSPAVLQLCCLCFVGSYCLLYDQLKVRRSRKTMPRAAATVSNPQ